jgi:hypothetical protein
MGQNGDRIREQDRVVWVGDNAIRPVGSSGKVREIDGKGAFVDWGSGSDGWYEIGVTIVSCKEAARRGIEPWAKAFGREG